MPGSVKVNLGGGLTTRFPRVAQTRAHVYIAEQLRHEITLGLLLRGDALPPERELAAMFGVARPLFSKPFSCFSRRAWFRPAGAGEAAPSLWGSLVMRCRG